VTRTLLQAAAVFAAAVPWGIIGLVWWSLHRQEERAPDA
jgi:hypothetical protein